MKVTIERSVLLKALGHVHRIVERRNTIPILANVLIEAGEGRLSLKSTDLDLEAAESVPADVAQKPWPQRTVCLRRGDRGADRTRHACVNYRTP